jgi:hypothetical protein
MDARKAALFEESFQHVPRLVLAVDKRHLSKRSRSAHRFGVFQEVVLTRMGAEAVEYRDFRTSLSLDAENPYPWLQLDQSASKRVLSLKADDEHGVLLALDRSHQMVDHASELAHPACGDHHARLVASIDSLGVLDGRDVP